MRLFAYIATLTLIMVSCGTDSKHFKLEGRLLNLNQGEFYVYSPDSTQYELKQVDLYIKPSASIPQY